MIEMFTDQGKLIIFIIVAAIVGIGVADEANGYTINIRLPNGFQDIVIREGDNPCEVLKLYCIKINNSRINDCVSLLHPILIKELVKSNWTHATRNLDIDVSFFVDCHSSISHQFEPSQSDQSNLMDILGLQKGGSTNNAMQAKCGFPQELLHYLAEVPDWIDDQISLKYFHERRTSMKLTDQERIELYTKAILIFPNSLFIVNNLGTSLMYTNRQHMARKLFANAVKIGLWDRPLQRPELKYVRGLLATPWHNKNNYPFISSLEANYLDIKNEFLDNLKLHNRGMFTTDKEHVHIRGDWSLLKLISDGVSLNISKSFRKTMNVLEMSGMSFIDVKFSSLQPGTLIRPHTGPFNGRLRIHLTLIHSEGARIRVGWEWRTWELGKAIVFDSSFEHEVKHEGSGTRVVLILDIWHPQLPKDQKIPLPYT